MIGMYRNFHKIFSYIMTIIILWGKAPRI